MSDGDPQDRGDHIATSTENPVNWDKKEEHTINEDLKLVGMFVNKVRSGLKEVGDTCKPLEEGALRVPENLPDEWKMQCDVSFAWEKRFWLQADIAGCHGGWYHSFLASCFYWARVGIPRKSGYEAEISISGAFPIANKVLGWQSAVSTLLLPVSGRHGNPRPARYMMHSLVNWNPLEEIKLIIHSQKFCI